MKVRKGAYSRNYPVKLNSKWKQQKNELVGFQVNGVDCKNEIQYAMLQIDSY